MAVKQWIQIFGTLAVLFFALPLYAEDTFQCRSSTYKMRACDTEMVTAISGKYSGTPEINNCQLFSRSLPGYLIYEFYVSNKRKIIWCKDVQSQKQCTLTNCEILNV